MLRSPLLDPTAPLEEALSPHVGQPTTLPLVHQLAESLGRAIDAKDGHTLAHSEEVAVIGQALAQSLGIPSRLADRIHVAGPLHDIGKIGVPDAPFPLVPASLPWPTACPPCSNPAPTVRPAPLPRRPRKSPATPASSSTPWWWPPSSPSPPRCGTCWCACVERPCPTTAARASPSSGTVDAPYAKALIPAHESQSEKTIFINACYAAIDAPAQVVAAPENR